MNVKPGIILQSNAALAGTIFENATILITRFNHNGAVGFVLNKPFYRKLNELEAFSDCPSLPIFEGGPVDQAHLFFLHARPDLLMHSEVVTDNLFMGDDLRLAATYLLNGKLNSSELKIFIGYCGWDAGELEAEIEEGSWKVMDSDSNIFTT